MKNSKLIFRTLTGLLLMYIMTSCSMVPLRQGINNLELGTEKSAVIKKLGKDYLMITKAESPEGLVEVIRYTEIVRRDNNKTCPMHEYTLYFLDGILKEINYEPISIPVFMVPIPPTINE